MLCENTSFTRWDYELRLGASWFENIERQGLKMQGPERVHVWQPMERAAQEANRRWTLVYGPRAMVWSYHTCIDTWSISRRGGVVEHHAGVATQPCKRDASLVILLSSLSLVTLWKLRKDSISLFLPSIFFLLIKCLYCSLIHLSNIHWVFAGLQTPAQYWRIVWDTIAACQKLRLVGGREAHKQTSKL